MRESAESQALLGTGMDNCMRGLCTNALKLHGTILRCHGVLIFTVHSHRWTQCEVAVRSLLGRDDFSVCSRCGPRIHGDHSVSGGVNIYTYSEVHPATFPIPSAEPNRKLPLHLPSCKSIFRKRPEGAL